MVTAAGLIVTCSHVVQDEGEQEIGLKPPRKVVVEFPNVAGRFRASVRRAWWRPADKEDVAFLALDGMLPMGVKPVLFGSTAGASGHRFRTFGFPRAEAVDGLHGYGMVGDTTVVSGQTLLQLTGTTEVTIGFSGAPVLDLAAQRVLGIVTGILAPDENGKMVETAFVTPAETLRKVCPLLALGDECPYRGLDAFSEQDSEYFHGREALVGELLERLSTSPRFLAVIGPSGSGKSSVVQAGLIPALRRGAMVGSQDWHLLPFRPGTDPFRALAEAGLAGSADGDLHTSAEAYLRDRPDATRLVLLADRCEELFFAPSSRANRERFFGELVGLLAGHDRPAAPALPVTLVLVMRADYYGHLLQLPQDYSLAGWLKAGQVNVTPMSSEGLRAAVVEPARKVGLTLEPGLAEAILKDAGEASNPLPLVESALTQLWAQREMGVLTHAAYVSIGRVSGAISRWAEDAYSGLAPEDQFLTQRLFKRLIHYGEGEAGDTRKSCILDDLTSQSDERERAHLLVRRLADARLVTTDREPVSGRVRVEIVHDALTQQWGRLRRWVVEQREFLLWRQRLDEHLHEWDTGRGLLLRDRLLVEAERWLNAQPDDLNPEETGYIKKGLQQRDRERVTRERRRRVVVLAACMVLLTTSSLAAFSALAWRRSEGLRQEALARQLSAQAQTALDSTATGLIESILLSAESLRRHPSLEPAKPLGRALALLPRVAFAPAYDQPVYNIAFSPDGKRLAVAEGNLVRLLSLPGWAEDGCLVHQQAVGIVAFTRDSKQLVAATDRAASTWDLATGTEVRRLVPEGGIARIRLSADDRLLVTVGEDGTARAWDAASGQLVSRMVHGDEVNALAVAPDGSFLVTASDSSVWIWRISTGTVVGHGTHDGTVWDVAISPNGQLIASASDDFTARLWRAATADQLQVIQQNMPPAVVAFSPDGKYLATGGDDGYVHLLDGVTGEKLLDILMPTNLWDLEFSPSGELLATRSSALWAPLGSEVSVWAVPSGREVARMLEEGGTSQLEFSPDGRYLGTVAPDHTARIWDTKARTEVTRLASAGFVEEMALSPDGRRVVALSRLTPPPMRFGWAAVQVWDTASTEDVGHLAFCSTGCDTEIAAVASVNDGRFLASSVSEELLSVRDITRGELIAQFACPVTATAIALSTGGRYVAVGGADSRIRVWDIGAARTLPDIPCDSPPRGLRFTADSQLLVMVLQSGILQVAEVGSGRVLSRAQFTLQVSAMAFSPDGRLLATAVRDLFQGTGEVRLWRMPLLQPVGVMVPRGGVDDVEFSSDGEYLAVANEGTLVFWQVTTCQEVVRWEGDPFPRVCALTFSPDGHFIYLAGYDSTVQAWPWQPRDLLEEACSKVTRNLTRVEWRRYLGGEAYCRTCRSLP